MTHCRLGHSKGPAHLRRHLRTVALHVARGHLAAEATKGRFLMGYNNQWGVHPYPLTAVGTENCEITFFEVQGVNHVIFQ